MVKTIFAKLSLVAATAIVMGTVSLPYTIDFSTKVSLTKHTASAHGGNRGRGGDRGGGEQGRGDHNGGEAKGDTANSKGQVTAQEQPMSIDQAIDNFDRDFDSVVDTVFGGDED